MENFNTKNYAKRRNDAKSLVISSEIGYNKDNANLFRKGETSMFDKTMTFSMNEEREIELKRTLTIIYDALVQKGYNPINQIVGYILSEDPTYITTHNNARNLIRHIDRDELLRVLVRSYLKH